jgi:hypothetical protein
VHTVGATDTVAGIAGVKLLFLPGKHDAGDADYFRLHVEAGNVGLHLFRLQLAYMVTNRAADPATGLIQAGHFDWESRGGAGRMQAEDPCRQDGNWQHSSDHGFA